jgi:predicted site-specific integrase-resolvase
MQYLNSFLTNYTYAIGKKRILSDISDIGVYFKMERKRFLKFFKKKSNELK